MSNSTVPAGVPRRRVRALGVLACILLAALALAAPAVAQEDDGDGSTVEILPVSGLLDPPVANTIIDLLADASAGSSELVILRVDGPGGVSVDMQGLVTAIEEATVPVAVYVAPDQRSAATATASGAWGVLWAAADIRIVSQLSAVGPLLPVDLADRDDDDVANRVLAAMDPGNDDGATVDRLRTETVDGLTLEDAGLADVVALSYVEAMDELDGRTVATAAGPVQMDLGLDSTPQLYSMGLLSRMLHAAATPAFIYLLLVFGLGMLAFEVFQPGFGVAGFAGLLLLPFAVFGLTVLPLVWWALGLILLGMVAYMVDTAIAGLGPVTALATASFGVGSWFVFGSGPLRNPTWVAVAITIAALGFWLVAMTMILRAQAGPDGVELEGLVGKLGLVRSVLNPQGHVYIDEALWRARLEGEDRLRVSAPIRVVAVDGAVLVVEPFDATASTSSDGGRDVVANP